jgi:hypothetical protein
MALDKQSLQINFSKGLDLKTDPFQLDFGNFLELENAVFNKGKLLAKRNGFADLPELPAPAVFATTFNGNLTAIGENLLALSAGSQTWLTKGAIQTLRLETMALVRSNTSQTQVDTAISDNGFVCTVFTDSVPSSGVASFLYKYVIADSVTGQNIVAPTLIGTVTGAPRVFYLGKYFIIVFPNSTSLQYIAINSVVPTSVTSPVTITSQYLASTISNIAYDGVVANNNLYVAWNATDGGGAVRVNRLDSFLTLYAGVDYATYSGDYFSVTADTTTATPTIWVTFQDRATSLGYSLAVNQELTAILAPTQITSLETITNITTAARSNVLYFYYEIPTAYIFNSSIPTYTIRKNTVTISGTLGTVADLKRSVGLASKAFTFGDDDFFLSVYQSDNQATFFLLNSLGTIVSKLAYANAGGYLAYGLPSFTLSDNEASVGYLVKTTVDAVNKTQGATINGIYSQIGANLVKFTLDTSDISAAELGKNLHLSGGILWAYDGYQLTEQGFHLYPDNVAAVSTANFVRNGTTTNLSPIITAIASTFNLAIGMNVSGAGIPVNSRIIAITGSTVTLNNNASSSAAGVAITYSGNMTNQQYYYQVTYEWSDNQGNIFRSAPSLPVSVAPSANNFVILSIPTLRMTAKTQNPVKLVVYRWSTAQQTYYQTTSILLPILNDTTIDEINFTDINADSTIVGNNILYTTGGVVENIGPPAFDAVTIFKNRLWGITSENKNLLWYSKPLLEATPVEMSDLFTVYVAPVVSAQGAPGSGPTTAISAMDDKLIMFKEDCIYYLTGTGPDITGANNDFSEPTFVTGVVGCSNQQSIVFTPKGLMFQSSKGIWLLGRDLSTTYIGAQVENFNSSVVLSAVNIPDTNQVRFTLDTGETLMYDYFYDQWGTFTGVSAITSTIYQGQHTIINSFDQVRQERPGFYLDGSRPVNIKVKTAWLNPAGLQGYERAYFMYLLGVYLSPHTLSVGIAYDYNDAVTQVSEIMPINYAPKYGGAPLYGSDVYGGPGKPEQHRVFFDQQKCQAFQITISENYDPSFGVAAGAGLTISGLNMIIGVKDNKPKLAANLSVG